MIIEIGKHYNVISVLHSALMEARRLNNDAIQKFIVQKIVQLLLEELTKHNKQNKIRVL